MLTAKTKKAFKGFKILKKEDFANIILIYKLMDSHDHIVNLELYHPYDSKIVEFVESLGYWEVNQ